MSILDDELKKLNKMKLRHKAVAIMGRLEHVEIISNYLANFGIQTSYVFDNNENKIGNYIDNIPIVRPKLIRRNENGGEDINIIIYSPRYHNEMVEQLYGLGYKKKQVIVLSKSSFWKNIVLALRGDLLFTRLQKQYGRDTLFLLHTSTSYGDLYLTDIFMKKYCEEKGISRVVYLERLKNAKELNDLLGIEHYKICTDIELESLALLWRVKGGGINLKPTTIWIGDFYFNRCQTCKLFEFKFIDMFKFIALGLPETTLPIFPKRINNDKAMEQVFEQRGLRANRTILLVPYSYSLLSYSKDFWKRLCKEIISLDYDVVVNIKKGIEDNFLDGISEISLSFAEIIDFIEYGGYVVGIRSGFFDITAQANCKRIVLYPPNKQDVKPWFTHNLKYSGLVTGGLCKDAIEIEENDEETTIRKVISELMDCKEKRKK